MARKQWVLLDFDGEPIRYYTYPAKDAVEIKELEYEIDWDNYEECLF